MIAKKIANVISSALKNALLVMVSQLILFSFHAYAVSEPLNSAQLAEFQERTKASNFTAAQNGCCEYAATHIQSSLRQSLG